MSWKIVSFATLVVLTVALVSYSVSLYERPYDLYMWVEEKTSPGAISITLEDLSDLEQNQILSYFKASEDVRSYIKISDEWCPIREWAESMYNAHGSLFNVKHENTYYQVSLWLRESHNPSALENNMNMILSLC